ncbi:hypothetical protein AgCh_030413 [Apium graveolens]
MKELYKFNIAMLAKQGWRLVNNVNPLVSSLMKARYYPKEDFLNAAMWSNPSFMWRSILTAHDLLKHGCRRRIGNGDKTRIWKVPWLPDVDNGYLSTDKPLELQNAIVSGLMEIDNRRWDEEVISDLCNDRDKELILSIPLSMGAREDGRYWLLDPKGNFTVRSGYRFLQGEQPKPYAKFWRKMWSLRLPREMYVDWDSVLELVEAEAMAFKEAMQWALVNGWKTCIFESDAKMMVDTVHSVAGNSPFYFIVRDCVNLFRYFDELQVCHIRRSANGVTHVLAQAARSMSDLVQVWHVVVPEFISHVIVADMG